jgi:hypothetical protein
MGDTFIKQVTVFYVLKKVRSQEVPGFREPTTPLFVEYI